MMHTQNSLYPITFYYHIINNSQPLSAACVLKIVLFSKY